MFKWDGDKDKREGQQDKSESKQKSDSNNERAEPFAEMAKFFTESRLLQQNVKLLIEGVSNQLVLATVIHPVSVFLHYVHFPTYVCSPHFEITVSAN